MKNLKLFSFFSKRFYFQFPSIAFLLILFFFSCSVQSSNDYNDNDTIAETGETTTTTEQIDETTKKVTEEQRTFKEQERKATEIEILKSGGKTPYKWVWVTYYRSVTWWYGY